MPINVPVAEYMRLLSPKPTQMRPAGRLSEKIRCVLFDIYGTLFISGSGDIRMPGKKSGDSARLRRLLHRYDIAGTPEDLIEALYDLIEKTHKDSTARGIDHPEVRIERVWAKILKPLPPNIVRNFAVEFELIMNPVFPMPHLQETLAACRQRRLLMGMISNAQFYTPYLFEWFLDSRIQNLGFHPDLVLFSYEFGCAKPSPILFDTAKKRLRKMGIFPHAVLYVGNDMRNDMLPASRAGFKTALFAGDARSLRLRETDPQCTDVSPDIVMTDLNQLLEHIDP